MGCWVSLRTPTHGKSEKQSFGFHDPEAGQTSSVLLVSMSHKFNPPDIASLIGTGFSGLSMPFILLISPQFRFAGLPHRGLFKSSTTTVVMQLDNLLTPNQDPFRSQLFPVFRFGTPKIKKIILYIIVYHLVMKFTRRDRGSQVLKTFFINQLPENIPCQKFWNKSKREPYRDKASNLVEPFVGFDGHS